MRSRQPQLYPDAPPGGRGGSAALGADATPSRPTSGTLTPATRSRARSSCAPPVSGRGPALVTGGSGPGAAGAGRAAGAGAGCLRRAPSSPGASGRPRAAAEPSRPLPPASKVRERETEAGSGRSGAPGAGPFPRRLRGRFMSAPGEGCTPGGRGRGAGDEVRGAGPVGELCECPRDSRRTRPCPQGRAVGTARRPRPERPVTPAPGVSTCGL